MSDIKIQAPIKVELKVIVTDGEGSFGEVSFDMPVMRLPTKEDIDEAIAEVSESDILSKNGMRVATKRETFDYITLERTGSTFAMPGHPTNWD